MKKKLIIFIALLTSFNAFSQSIVSVNPYTAHAGQTLDVTITGANTTFSQGSNTNYLNISDYFGFTQGSATTNITQNSYNVINDTSMVVNLSIGNTIHNGFLDFRMYDQNWIPFGLKDAFYVNAPNSPQILSVNPSYANAGQTLDVTITGANTNFLQGSNTNYLYISDYFGFTQGSATTNITQNSYNVINDTSMVVNLSIGTNIRDRFLDFRIYDQNWIPFGLKDAFYINPSHRHSLVSINPSNANAGQTLNVTITGTNTHFLQGSGTFIEFEFGQGSGTTVVNSYSVLNDSILSANITIPSNIYSGYYDITAYNVFDGYINLTNGLYITGTSCNLNAGFTYTDLGNGTYSFNNTSSGNIILQKWNFGDGNLSIATSPTHTFVANGTHVVVLTIADAFNLYGSCYDYFAVPITVTGVSNPLACNSSFSMYTDLITNRVIVINSSTGNNLSYFWDFGDGSTSNQIYPNHTYGTQGPYFICLTVNNGSGCIDTYCDSIGSNGLVFKSSGFAVDVQSPTSVDLNETFEILSEVNIYPNPNNGEIFVNLEKYESTIKATIRNILGEVIYYSEFRQTNHFSIEISVPSGIYILQIETPNSVYKNIKIVKQNY